MKRIFTILSAALFGVNLLHAETLIGKAAVGAGKGGPPEAGHGPGGKNVRSGLSPAGAFRLPADGRRRRADGGNLLPPSGLGSGRGHPAPPAGPE